MTATVAEAAVKLQLDINFGDPVTPAPATITYPGLRDGLPPVQILGYPLATVLAEKPSLSLPGPAMIYPADQAPARREAPVADRARAGITIDTTGLPPALIASLKHAASMANPAFYARQRRRASTWDAPRFLRSYDETLDGHLVLPRGLLDTVTTLTGQGGSRLDTGDVRARGPGGRPPCPRPRRQPHPARPGRRLAALAARRTA